MLELFHIHRERHPMYRQATMEHEQQEQPEQIFTKLGELPMVNDAYSQVMDLYERTKGHNCIFRSYLGMVEYTAKVVAGTAVPRIYGTFQMPIDRANNYACEKLDTLESTFPIITRPTQEVMQETQEKYEQYWPYVEPVARPVLIPAKMAYKAGKTAVDVGTAVATTAMKPAVYAVRTGTAVTSAVVNTGKSAMSSMTSGFKATGEKMMDSGLDTALGKFIVEQADVSLDSIEKLMDFYLPAEKESNASNRKERVVELASRVHDAVLAKAKGDLVRAQLILGNFLQELVELVGHLVTLTKDGTQTACKEVVDAVTRVWNKFVEYLPPDVAKSVLNVKERITTLVVFLIGKVGELFSQSALMASLAVQNISNLCSHFFTWCQSTPQLMKAGAGQLMKWIEVYLPELAKFIPTILEFLHNLLDKVVDTLDVFGIAGMRRRRMVSSLQVDNGGENVEMEELN
ncbi:perilipin-2-like isoform X2 [Littorina saxatilis]|uniref:Uncharacterized protein n=2 Tax=Littorina saxatilis TaxID=31220 RepID=A0AAN9C2U1_9CAEN